MGQSQANISGHLKSLASSGLVTSYRRSYWTHYALVRTLPADISRFLAGIMQQATGQNPGDLLALEQLPADVCALRQKQRQHAREGSRNQSSTIYHDTATP